MTTRLPHDSECADVHRFHTKFGFLTSETPTHVTRRRLKERIQCMQEELHEFTEAMATQDLAAMADALIDLVYFAKGTAVMLGLPWKDLWDDVQRANMSKVRGVGPRGHKADCVKPVNWMPPVTEQILQAAGYDRSQFTAKDAVITFNPIDEARCLDDAADK